MPAPSLSGVPHSCVPWCCCGLHPGVCRFPSPVVFDQADPAHAAFIQAAAILKAQVRHAWGPALQTNAQGWLPRGCSHDSGGQPATYSPPQPLELAMPSLLPLLLTILIFMFCPAFPICQVYGLSVPDWASDAARTAAVAAEVAIEPFVPQENVKIETGGCAAAGASGALDSFLQA